MRTNSNPAPIPGSTDNGLVGTDADAAGGETRSRIWVAGSGLTAAYTTARAPAATA